jgi:hypothetical protein
MNGTGLNLFSDSFSDLILDCPEYRHIGYILNLLKLDLENGMYITGSFITWLLERKYHGKTPSWLPDDLDIVCRNRRQHLLVNCILKPLSSSVKETNWLLTHSTYYTINDFRFQSFIHTITARERIKYTDFSVNSMASDGVACIADSYAMDDIRNKILRFTGDTGESLDKDRVIDTKKRYKKYLDRGYIDVNNASLNKINQLYEEILRKEYMNISLRKASVLQNSINDAVKGIDLKGQVTLTEFHNPIMEIDKATTLFKTNLSRRDALVRALYDIRKQVSAANSRAGVDDKLTEIASLEKQIQNYTALAGNEVREKEAVVLGKLDKIKNRKEDARSIYGYENTVSTSVFTEEDIKGFKVFFSMAKKAKQKLQDEVLELNVRTDISLSADTVQTLMAEALL